MNEMEADALAEAHKAEPEAAPLEDDKADDEVC